MTFSRISLQYIHWRPHMARSSKIYDSRLILMYQYTEINLYTRVGLRGWGDNSSENYEPNGIDLELDPSRIILINDFWFAWKIFGRWKNTNKAPNQRSVSRVRVVQNSNFRNNFSQPLGIHYGYYRTISSRFNDVASSMVDYQVKIVSNKFFLKFFLGFGCRFGLWS